MQWVSHGELRELLGSDAAGALCRTFGGVHYYIPAEPSAAHPFTPILGTAGMRVLCNTYGGEKITLPNWKRPEPKKGEILSRLEKGESPRSIAIALEVTERWVWVVAEVYKPRARQLSLLDGS
ncbi:MAG: RNA helicase [Desulfovibrio sp.]|jgi:hypothetical protein|nr:RNA helicase [Desulfovibrio sp.]